MSKIREKSNFNFDAAALLLKNSLYAPSVHCSYYSCFQLLKYTIKDFFGVDYDNQSINIAKTRQRTHQYVINYIVNELKKYSSANESRGFKRKINDLKQLRIESDYENIEISLDKGTKAFDKAKEIRTFLIKKFNL